MSLTERFDTVSAGGRLIMHIFAVIYGLMAYICGFAIWLATPHKNANTLT